MNTSSRHQADYDGHAQGRHAVVLGGSLAGLLAARVLSDHFDEVTLIERDVFKETAEVRRGIPQANHVHGLLLRGREVLEEFFPGLQDEMIADGVPLVDMANEIAWYTRAGWGIRFPSEMKVLAFTRPVLDLHVRRRLSSNPRVKLIDNTDVLRLIPDAEKNRLAGVLICPRASESDRRVARELRADLVVDTTGRASRAPRWLNDIGYVIPEETVVDAHLGYASRLYRIPDDFDRDWKCAYVQSAPPVRNRGAILFEVEGNRWLVTLTGGARDYPPSDEAGFLEFARSLPVSTIYDAMCAAEPLTPIKTHRGTENRLRHFERAKELPDNFLLLGDAVCAFNPVYGQGMTTAALGALTLRNTLRENGNPRGLSRRFLKRLGKVIEAPWLLATGEDYRYPATEGHGATLMTKFMHRYMNHVIALATESVAVRHVLLRAFSMMIPPTALFHPRISLRVLLHVLKERKRHENADRNHRRERQMGGRQKVSENRLVS